MQGPECVDLQPLQNRQGLAVIPEGIDPVEPAHADVRHDPGKDGVSREQDELIGAVDAHLSGRAPRRGRGLQRAPLGTRSSRPRRCSRRPRAARWRMVATPSLGIPCSTSNSAASPMNLRFGPSGLNRGSGKIGRCAALSLDWSPASGIHCGEGGAALQRAAHDRGGMARPSGRDEFRVGTPERAGRGRTVSAHIWPTLASVPGKSRA